jgi:hypothetical protein
MVAATTHAQSRPGGMAYQQCHGPPVADDNAQHHDGPRHNGSDVPHLGEQNRVIGICLDLLISSHGSMMTSMRGSASIKDECAPIGDQLVLPCP